MTYPAYMKHEFLPESCNELVRQRDEAVKRLGEVSIRLSTTNDEYLSIVRQIIEISRQIDEIA